MPEDSRGVWALGQIGASVTWAHGINGDAYGPNNQLPDSDDILNGLLISAKYGMEGFYSNRMPFCGHCRFSNQATARSMHPNGVMILLADGGARFASDTINPSAWHVLHSRETPAGFLHGRLDDLCLQDNRRSRADTLEYRDAVDGLPATTTHASDDHDSQAKQSTFTNSVGMTFVRIPPGAFTMGLPDAGPSWPFPDADSPPHQVTLDQSFWMSACEVTQGHYETVMGTNPSWHTPTNAERPELRDVDGHNLPVDSVTWYDAIEFCNRLSLLEGEVEEARSYRLPTEAEWEYCCRAGSSEARRFVSTWDVPENFDELAGKPKHPTREPLTPRVVGSFEPNGFGLYDMRGNLFEWCHDWFDRSYYDYSPARNPQGPTAGFLKVVRGWDWVFIGPQCKDFHVVTPPWRAHPYIGFRVVCGAADVAR